MSKRSCLLATTVCTLIAPHLYGQLITVSVKPIERARQGQKSKLTDDFDLALPLGQDVRWEFQLPSEICDRVSLCLMRDRRRSIIGKRDLVISDHLVNNSSTSGSWGEHDKRLYFGRLTLVDEGGVHHRVNVRDGMGGVRAIIKGFSQADQRRFLPHINSIAEGFNVVAHQAGSSPKIYGGNGGDAQELSLPDKWHISRIIVHADKRLDGLDIYYKDPVGEEHKSDHFGGRGGKKYSDIEFASKERLIGISGKVVGDRIGQISFRTNKRTFGPYGKSGKKDFQCVGSEIIGFRIRSGDEIDAIGCVSR